MRCQLERRRDASAEEFGREEVSLQNDNRIVRSCWSRCGSDLADTLNSIKHFQHAHEPRENTAVFRKQVSILEVKIYPISVLST
jgi:hypothetical protein